MAQTLDALLDLGTLNTYQVSTATRQSATLSSNQFRAALLGNRGSEKGRGFFKSHSLWWVSILTSVYPSWAPGTLALSPCPLLCPLLCSTSLCKLTAPTCTPLVVGSSPPFGLSVPSLDSSSRQTFLSLNQTQALYNSSPCP